MNPNTLRNHRIYLNCFNFKTLSYNGALATNTISGIHGAHIEGAEITKQQSHRQSEPDDIYDELQIEPLVRLETFLQ